MPNSPRFSPNIRSCMPFAYTVGFIFSGLKVLIMVLVKLRLKLVAFPAHTATDGREFILKEHAAQWEKLAQGAPGITGSGENTCDDN